MYCQHMNSVPAREDPRWCAAGRRRPFLLLTPCACPASFPAVPGLEVELVDIVLRKPERIPQHDHVLQRERTLGRDVLERCHRVARAQPSAGTLACIALSLRVPARLA